MFTFLSQKSNETSGANGVARGQVPLPGSRARQPWQAECERRPQGAADCAHRRLDDNPRQWVCRTSACLSHALRHGKAFSVDYKAVA